MLHLIQNIRTIRKQKGISQESVAYDLGIDYSTYGKIERGQIALTVDRLEKIATILAVTVQELYKWHEVTPAKSTDSTTDSGDSTSKALHKCQLELESCKREVALLEEQLRDKEKIIELLEHKLTKGK